MSISEAKRREIESRRREQILSVALGMFYEKGYRNTTMAEIAKAANISKGLIYHYFESKAEILFSYQDKLDACLMEINAMPSAKEAIREFGRRFLLYELDESGYIPPLQVYVIVFIKGEMDDPDYMDMNPIYQDFGREYFGPLFEKGMNSGEFKQGNPGTFGDIYWHYLLGSMVDFMQEHRRVTIDSSLDAVLDLFKP